VSAPRQAPGAWTTRTVLQQPAVRWAWLAMFLSSIATVALTVTIGVLVYDITGNKLDLGWLGLIEFLPTAILVPITGTLADRYDRRIIAASGLAVETMVVLFFVAVVRGTPTSVLPIYLGVAVFGCARAVIAPASRSLMPASAPDALALPKVIALSAVGWQIGAIVGPIVGTVAYDWKPEHSFEIIAVFMVGAIGCALTVPASVGRAHVSGGRPARPTARTALEGLSVIRRQPVLLGAISLDLFAVLFGGAVALLPAIAKDVLHGGAAEVGIMRTAGGIGAALVTLAVAARPVRRNVGKCLFAAVAVFGAGTVVLGFASSIVVACIAMFALNAADSVSVFIRGTLVPLVTPPEQRGRVLAVEAVFIGGSNELGAFESGVAARLVGTTAAVVSGGLAVIGIIGLFWFVFPALRDINRFEDMLDAPPGAADPAVALTTA
jgi:MFS family permease